MYAILLFFFVLVSLLLTFVILIQSSKGGGLAGTFGGSDAMGTMFGGRGSASFLTKVTSVLAALFLFIALIMGMMTRGTVSETSLIERERARHMSSPARTLPQLNEPAGETPASPPAQEPEE
jgi:preprotein translocase subunit SecG